MACLAVMFQERACITAGVIAYGLSGGDVSGKRLYYGSLSGGDVSGKGLYYGSLSDGDVSGKGLYYGWRYSLWPVWW